MTDRELLTLAAKAAGIEYEAVMLGSTLSGGVILRGRTGYWNPLTDDGDALRLAVKIGLEVSCDGVDRITVGWPDRLHPASKLAENCIFYSHITEPKGADAAAATRRAIVRAAAEIGKAMQ